MSEPIDAVWNALQSLCDDAVRYVDNQSDSQEVREAWLAAAALEYAAACLDGQQADNSQARVLRR